MSHPVAHRAGPVAALVSVALVAVGCSAAVGEVVAGEAPVASASSASSATAGVATTPTSATASAPPGVDARTRSEVARLPLDRLVRQVIVPDAAGVSAGVSAIRSGYGGVVVMRSSLPTGRAAASAASAANARYRKAQKSSGRTWPAFIAVDQEGGPVTRIDAPLTPFPAAMALGATGRPDLATAVGRASGAELRGLGFTVVLAPDADVTTPADPTIGVRSPGSDPAAVARTAVGYVDGYRAAGLLPVVKHFPGHGGVATDTHRGTATLPASRAQLEARDLRPFREAVAAGVPAVMTAHVVATAVDRRRPASMSRAVTTGLLRGELGFRGLVVTDALDMGAATTGVSAGESAVRALEAGADVLLMPADPAAAAAGVAKAVRSGRLPRARLEESAARMVAALRSTHATVPAQRPGAGLSTARHVAAASITQLGGRCGRALVGRTVSVSGGTPDDRAEFTRAAEAHGLTVRRDRGTRVALLGGAAYRAGGGGASGSTRVRGDVLVALDVPYALADGTASARVAAFGRTPPTFDALLDVLTGRRRAAGHLPVPVGAWTIGAGCG